MDNFWVLEEGMGASIDIADILGITRRFPPSIPLLFEWLVMRVQVYMVLSVVVCRFCDNPIIMSIIIEAITFLDYWNGDTLIIDYLLKGASFNVINLASNLPIVDILDLSDISLHSRGCFYTSSGLGLRIVEYFRPMNDNWNE